jgi:pyridoxal phosphate enzyme (YggS family)
MASKVQQLQGTDFQGMQELSAILADIRGRIENAAKKAGRSPDEIEIIAVTKTHGAEVVQEAWDAGLGIVGENKVQEAMWKKSLSVSGPEWHLIGHLQGNKVRHALETFDFIHSVDSLKLIDRISAISRDAGFSPHILLEVNVSGEKSKTGMDAALLPQAVERVLESGNIWLEGLMTMAPFSENPEDSRPFFRKLRELRDEMETRFGIKLPRLSMGMSGDYEVAVEEGATWLRLGTVLFGERPKIKAVKASSDEPGEARQFGALDSYSGEGPTFKVLD